MRVATKVKPRSTTSGIAIEDLACQYLLQRGLKIKQRNFTCKVGELDIIAEDQNTLVFVEVRFRKNADFGSAAESIDWRKRRKLVQAARLYLITDPVGLPCRFDVIAISNNLHAPQIEWIKDAFHVEHEID